MNGQNSERLREIEIEAARRAEAEALDPATPFRSKVFKMNAVRFGRELVFRYAGIWLVTLLVVALAGLAAGVSVDFRWLIIALMIVFIVIPMLLFFFYYGYGLRRECYVNALPHSIIISDRGITAELVLPNRRKSTEEADKDGNNEEDIKRVEEFFPYDMMSEFNIGLNSAIIPLRGKGKGFLWIPKYAFEKTEDYFHAMNYIEKRIASK